MEKPYVLGIDIGGTNTVYGIVNARGEIILRGSIHTKDPQTGEHHDNVNEYLDVLIPELEKLIEKVGGKDLFKGVGIGAPNGNYHTGKIEFAANIKWAKGKEVQFADPTETNNTNIGLISQRLGLNSILTNDANAAAIGELHYGIAKERSLKHYIMITLGTGVGSGIIVNGYMVYGHDAAAGELGHVTVRPYNGRLCGCGRCGCLETYASAPGIARTAREMLESEWDRKKKEDDEIQKDSILRNISDQEITAKDVFDAAEKGDKLAIEVFNITGRILGEAFTNFVAFSSPEAIILFGGPAKAGEFIRKPIVDSMNANMLTVYKLTEEDKKKDKYKIYDPEEGTTCKTKILFSKLPDADAAILGASALAWEIKK